MDNQMNRKDQILFAALTLFAEKGYDGVGVDEIAASLQMKGPALYHYFKGKEALLEALLEKLGSYYGSRFGSAEQIGEFPETVDELIEMSMKRLSFTIHDPQIRKVRRMLAMEQFRNEQFGQLTTQHHLTGIVEMNTRLIEHLIKAGKIKPYDPKLLAFEFSAPVSMLIHLIDREPNKEEEAMEQIRLHMQHFKAVYEK